MYNDICIYIYIIIKYNYIIMYNIYIYISPNMTTLGVLTVAVKAGCSFEVFSYVRAVSMTLTAQKFPCEMSMGISTAQARTNRVSWGPLFRRARFTSARYVHYVWQAWHFPDILSAGQA